VTDASLPRPVDLSGIWRAHAQVGDLARRFTEPSFDDSAWPELGVPGHWRSNDELASSDGPVLYRRRFDTGSLEGATRRFLTFDGIFYDGDVWLDGSYLGTTEGYFISHTFEITDLTRAASGLHVLAVEVACAVPDRLAGQRAILGAFAGSTDVDPRWNPGGIWRPVRLRHTGSVRIKWLRVLCSEATETRARLLLNVTLDPGSDPDGIPVRARLHATVEGPGGEMLAAPTRDVALAAGDNALTWTIDIDQPPRWWPWRLGEQQRCAVEVSVEVDDAPSDRRRLRTAFRDVRLHERHLIVNGEQLFTMGSTAGPLAMSLADAKPEDFVRDVQLARDANLDLLRVRAHVSRPELYEAADAAGLMLWQDLPLRGSYSTSTRKQALRQAREMVALLGHHPSIAMWCGHDDPFVFDGEGTRARIASLAPTWNKDVLDRSVARALRRADPTRPVDAHLGAAPDLGALRIDHVARAARTVPRLARFATGLGAPAVPEDDALLDPAAWPDLDWDELAVNHGYDREAFERHVPPSAYRTLAEWRTATQQHQAAVIQLQIEDLRRLELDPAGGFCHVALTDGHPAITRSVLDHERRPKQGYGALRDACRSVLPMLEPRQGWVHVASELRSPLAGAVVEADLDGRRRSWTGDIGPQRVTYVGRVHLDRRTTAVTLKLRHPAVGEIVNSYDTVLEWLRIVAGGI
jgi:beta-mannosidase